MLFSGVDRCGLLCLLVAEREVVGAEGRGGESGLIKEVANGVVGPAIADGQRLGHGGAGNENIRPVDLRRRRVPARLRQTKSGARPGWAGFYGTITAKLREQDCLRGS